MITRCTACLGKKTIVGLGMISKDCPACNGVGHIKVKKEEVQDEQQSERRRGRPKKTEK